MQRQSRQTWNYPYRIKKKTNQPQTGIDPLAAKNLTTPHAPLASRLSVDPFPAKISLTLSACLGCLFPAFAGKQGPPPADVCANKFC